MFKKLLATFVLISLLTLGASCSPHERPVSGVLNQACLGNPSMLNPLFCMDSATSMIVDYIYQGLVRYDENMQLVGQLAEAWDISQDNLEWTFYLRQDVTWHDGQPFTAEDVSFTIDTIAFNHSYIGSKVEDFDQLEKIEVLDDHTIKFSLVEPWALFLASLTQGILPRHIYDPNLAVGADRVSIADMAKHPRNWRPIGTGPFIFDSWADSQYITLKNNPDYYDSGPFIETICFKFFPDISGAISALEQGEVDLVPDIPFSEAQRLEVSLQEDHSFYGYQEMGYKILAFNFRPCAFGLGKDNPWLDRRVRQAIAHALNRQHYVEEALAGKGIVLNSPIPPASWAYSPGDTNEYSYDPEVAKLLLTEAGWRLGIDGNRYKDNQRLAFQLTVREENTLEITMAEMIYVDLKALGVEIELNAVPWQEMLVDHIYAGEFHLLLLGLSISPDPDVLSIFHSAALRDGLNFGAYSNSELDMALELGRQIGAIESRQGFYADVQKILTGDLPYVFLLSQELTLAVNSKVHGLKVSPLGFYKPEEWYIEEGQ